MKAKLFNMPMVRAYVTCSLLTAIPACLLVFGTLAYLTWPGNNTDLVKQQIESAQPVSGKVPVSELAMRADFHDITTFWIVASMVLFLFSGIAIRVLMGNPTVKTANELVDQARAAAAGDLTVAPVAESLNEYGQMQDAFGEMVTSFRSTIARIDQAAEDLRASAGEMAYTADEAGHAIGEVAQAIGAINEGATHQVTLVSASSDLVAGIEGSVRDTSEHAREAQRQSADTESLAEDGVQRAAEVQQAMQAVRESSLATADVIRALGEKSSDIDQIVQAITDIAQQTNMLALNASIEAARAGEQGKGFRNVAEEVRLLAEDAHSSAVEIATVVDEIQAQTAEAVGAMEDGVLLVEQGFETVNRNRQTFADISNAVHALHEGSTEISVLADGIAQGTGKVRRQIEEVASVAQQSSAATEQVSASTQQTTAAAEQVSASAQRVADTAETLAELSGRFTLPGTKRAAEAA